MSFDIRIGTGRGEYEVWKEESGYVIKENLVDVAERDVFFGFRSIADRGTGSLYLQFESAYANFESIKSVES